MGILLIGDTFFQLGGFPKIDRRMYNQRASLMQFLLQQSMRVNGIKYFPVKVSSIPLDTSVGPTSPCALSLL